MRISHQTTVEAPCEVVWEYIADPDNYPTFMEGDHALGSRPANRRSGSGARYRMLIRVGSAEVGGLIEVVEFNSPRDLAWSSVTGVDQRGRWRLRSLGKGGPGSSCGFSYGVAGAGLTGMLSEMVAAPGVRAKIRGSLEGLKRLAEGRSSSGPS